MLRKKRIDFVKHESMSPAMERYIRSTRTRRKYLTEKIREEKIGMEKLHLIFADTRERDCREKELQQMFPNLSICHATPFNIEIISGRAGKGNALVALGKILGIKREEIMACGDAPNDWNMLEMAGLPVVMANADEETKKKAAFITKSNEEDGVAYAVEQFVLKKWMTDLPEWQKTDWLRYQVWQREEKGKAKENGKKQHIRKMKGVYA